VTELGLRETIVYKGRGIGWAIRVYLSVLFGILSLIGAGRDQHGGCDRRQQRERAAPE
jgi:hypothetical protein